MKTKKETRANSAKKANATKQVENIVSIKAVESESTVTSLPAATESENKVSSKDVLRAAGSIRAAVKEERRGANVTIRLIAERAASGDAAAVDILCALCDVPRAALFSLNLEKIRAAVNAYYPYYMEVDNRKVSVKPVGVWYSTELPQVGKVKVNEPIEAAAKRVKRGYRAVAVVDYLEALIKAAKSRAKGVTPRCVDSNAVYSDCKMNSEADGITATEIDEAKERHIYCATAANVWRRDRNGFYI